MYGIHVTRKIFPVLSAVLVLSAVPTFGSEQQKAEKQTSRITAMASAAPTARLIVSQTMADMLGVPRPQLVRERRAMDLNYGSLFLAHQLVAAGAKMLDIAIQLQAGQRIVQIAQQQKVNWRSVADSAKKLNGKIEENIYKHFLHSEADARRALLEKYDPDKDLVKADLDVGRSEVLQTRDDYVFWRDRAGQFSGETLDPASETALERGAEVYKGPQRPHY
jgi:hypothetical protein